MKEIIINKDESGIIVALLENGKLVEEYDNIDNTKTLEGNIYCGIVRNVLPNMQSAFVDIGESKNAFIHIKDIIPKVSQTTGNKEEDYSKYKMKDFIKQKEPILVQIKKDKESLKGARVSKDISLVGRFCVLLINVNFITVSHKIEDENERNRLINIVKQVLPKGDGAIIRTSSNNINEELLKQDLDGLIKKWKQIKKDYDEHKLNGPKLVYDNKALLRRTLIDVVDQNLNKVIVNDKKTYKDVNDILKSMGMEEKIKLELKENEDLLEMHSLRSQVEKMSNRKIWLKCGGFITIDRTEALTAIDVNTGKYIGNNNLEQTVFKVNKEATTEIAKQLRLRDIGGIIIIDYIDMHEEENKKEIIKLLAQSLKKDRTKSQILGFTKLNLLEMTRKNMCNNDDY